MQYDPYKSGVVNIISSPVLTTIADDVRPPVVVVDHIKDQQQKNDQSTTAPHHKAEPGRDVFAGDPDKDGKSSSYVPPKQPEVKEDKQISTVGGVPTQQDAKNWNGVGPFESKPVIDSSATTSSTSAVDKVEDKVRAGAPDEGQVEAEKAAKELFPETTRGIE